MDCKEIIAITNKPFVFEIQNARAGNPAAPGISSLPMLPFGPDGVRRVPPRRTHPGMFGSIPQENLIVNKIRIVLFLPLEIEGCTKNERQQDEKDREEFASHLYRLLEYLSKGIG